MRIFFFMFSLLLFVGCDKQEPTGGVITGRPLDNTGQTASKASERKIVSPTLMAKPERTQWSFEQTSDLISGKPKLELLAHAKSQNFTYALTFRCGNIRSIEIALFRNDGVAQRILFNRDGGTYARWVRIRAGTEIIQMPVLRGEYANAGNVGLTNVISTMFAATNPNDPKIEYSLAQEHAKQLNTLLASNILNMADLVEGDAVEFLPDEGRESINAFLNACMPTAPAHEQSAVAPRITQADSAKQDGDVGGQWPEWDWIFERETNCQSDRFNFALTLKGIGSEREILVVGAHHNFKLDAGYASGRIFGSNPKFSTGDEQRFKSDFSEIRDYVIELSGSENDILFGDIFFEQRKNGVWAKTGSNLKFKCN